MASLHNPVMVKEVLQYLSKARISLSKSPLFIDGCAGHGGHSKQILSTFPNAQLLCIDRDPTMYTILKRELSEYANSVHIAIDSYSNMLNIVSQEYPNKKANGVLLDLGFNSGQIDDAKRGFSFIHDGPLDMRYDQSTGVTAADLINHLDARALTSIFAEYSGESLRTCKHVANCICSRRQKTPFTSTGDLASFLNSLLGKSKYKKTPCTTLFQALRIAVNNEFAQLDSVMQSMPELVESGGVVVFLCFQSMEVRRIKMWMRWILDPASDYRKQHMIEDQSVQICIASTLVFNSYANSYKTLFRRSKTQSSRTKHLVVRHSTNIQYLLQKTTF